MAEQITGSRRVIALVITGVLGGLLSGLFGIGGGIIMVPLLMWLVRLDQRRASATSLVAIFPAALVGAISYYARGDVDIIAGLVIAAGGIVGSIIGTNLLRKLPLGWLRWGFVALMLVVSVQTFLETPARDAEIDLTVWSVLLFLVLGVFMGIASGLFGIGGGTIVVPALVLGFGASDVLAKGTSLLAMLPASVTGSVRNVKAKLVKTSDGLIAGVAAVPMSTVGVALAFYLDPQTASRLFAALLFATALQLAWRAWKAQKAAS